MDAHYFPITDEEVPPLWGARGHVSSQLAAGTAYVYSPSQVRLVERVPFQVEVDRSRLFNADMSEIRLRGRFGVAVLNANAVLRGTAIA